METSELLAADAFFCSLAAQVEDEIYSDIDDIASKIDWS